MFNNQEERTIKQQIKALKSDKVTLRLEAIQKLAVYDNLSIIDPLLACLKDKDSQVRLYAALALRRFNNNKVTEAYFALLKDEDHQVRELAARLLTFPNRAPISRFLSALNDSDEYTRQTAVAFFSFSQNEQALEVMNTKFAGSKEDNLTSSVTKEIFIKALKDSSPKVRRAGVIGLAKMSAVDKSVIEEILAMLEDEAELVQKTAIQVLGELKEKRAVEPIITILDKANNNLGWYAVTALGKIGDLKAIPKLVLLLASASVVDKGAVSLAITRIKQCQNLELAENQNNDVRL